MSSDLRQFERLCIEEWTKIPLNIIRKFIESMPRRIEAVLQSKGDNTKY